MFGEKYLTHVKYKYTHQSTKNEEIVCCFVSEADETDVNPIRTVRLLKW